MTLRWNYDKPHRCPTCHTIWVYADKYAPSGQWHIGEALVPRWWKTYDCYACGAMFTGRWSWAEQWRDKVRGRLNYWRRKWRTRRNK